MKCDKIFYTKFNYSNSTSKLGPFFRIDSFRFIFHPFLNSQDCPLSLKKKGFKKGGLNHS